jgi:hypothetical protein
MVSTTVCVCGNNFADDLVSRDDTGIECWQLAFDDVKIGAADAAGEYTEQNVAGFRPGDGDVFDFERSVRDWARGGEDRRFHASILCARVRVG